MTNWRLLGKIRSWHVFLRCVLGCAAVLARSKSRGWDALSLSRPGFWLSQSTTGPVSTSWSASHLFSTFLPLHTHPFTYGGSHFTLVRFFLGQLLQSLPLLVSQMTKVQGTQNNYLYIFLFMFLYIYIPIYMFLSVCIYICVYKYHIYTHIYIQTWVYICF